MPEVRVIGLEGIPEIAEGDDLASLIAASVRREGLQVLPLDIFVIAQKIVSKAEGCIVELDSIKPSPLATEWANRHQKDARVVEVAFSQSRRIVRMDNGVLITETHHGFVCANAGVDTSNVSDGRVTLLPEDPDASAESILKKLEREFDCSLGVIISDTFGRPWREGLVNVALGVAGLAPIIDLRGAKDMYGQPLRVTTIALADEAASAAELVMAKQERVPVAIVRGTPYKPGPGSGRELIRRPETDLFR
ncbi:MAG TPA: coenzyme F420-0:L-glutamate ligase [Blastocatellia bacterium]|nr:coenzyme F420-0:L-glutamate ligase [Blastocatellia bacterium]